MTLITDPMDAPSVTAARKIGRDRGVGPSLLEANASISQILPPDTNKDVIIHFISSHSLRQFVVCAISLILLTPQSVLRTPISIQFWNSILRIGIHVDNELRLLRVAP